MRAILIALAILALAGDTFAQDSSATELRPGARVRVWSLRFPSDSIPYARTGRLLGADSVAIRMRRAGSIDTLAIPALSVVRVDVSHGGTSRGNGFVKGATIGALSAVSFALLALTDRSEAGAIGVAAALTVGLPMGALAGGTLGFALARGERWERVQWPPSR